VSRVSIGVVESRVYLYDDDQGCLFPLYAGQSGLEIFRESIRTSLDDKM
jgi:hypothetical protein